MALNVAINGFGRIGKAFLKIIVEDKAAMQHIKIVAINVGPRSEQTDFSKNVANFFKYDSTLGRFCGEVSYTNNTLIINKQEIKLFAEANPEKLPWKSLGIDWVIESSGKFTSGEKAALHIKAGSKKVLITAPATNEDVTIIPGVNDSKYDKEKHKIVSLGSCTTNCFAPIVKVLNENFALQQGFMTTVHAYTNNQALLDSEISGSRRDRAAGINIVPTSTGADKVIIKIYPELSGKLQSTAVRVPIALGSLIDFTFVTKNELSIEAINNAFKIASQKDLKGILHYETDPIVSSDSILTPYSCILDSLLTKANGNMGKVCGWYDNEYGYSCRLKDFLKIA